MAKYKTVAELVEAFGGPPALAVALNEESDLGLTRRNVYNWLVRENLPAQYDVALVSAARRKGIDITYEDLAQMRALVAA